MIKLRKNMPPQALAEKMRSRRERLVSLLACGEDVPPSIRDFYRDPDVKDLIKSECHDKCMYCESKIGHVYFGDVEHILPKSVFPHLTLDYDNLGLACAICNNSKLDYYEAETPLINPYKEDPKNEFVAAGPLLKARPGRDRAAVTERLLKLNRAGLFERRTERIERLTRAPSSWMAHDLNGDVGKEVADDTLF